MSLFELRKEPQGNLGQGGNLRAVGESEPQTPNAGGSNVEEEVKPQMEAIKRRELEILEQVLNMLGWRPEDVQSKIAKDRIFDEVRKLNKNFSYLRLDEHLKTLALAEKQRRFSIR